MLMRNALTAAAAGAVMLATAGAVWAGAIEDRQAAMKEIGKAIGELAKIAKKEAPFDASVVKANAELIAQKLESAKAMFPDDTKPGGAVETWAKAEIWTDRATFDALDGKAQEAAMKMAAVTDEAAFGPALGELGGSCKACHEKFRRPKE
jgi:cytochrome c556